MSSDQQEDHKKRAQKKARVDRQINSSSLQCSLPVAA